MQLVYLDQCVLSRFLEKPENEPWSELRELLLKGNVNRRILCPKSLEHLVETSSLPDGDAVRLDELLGRLSFGWALSNEFDLVAWQIGYQKPPMLGTMPGHRVQAAIECPCGPGC